MQLSKLAYNLTNRCILTFHNIKLYSWQVGIKPWSQPSDKFKLQPSSCAFREASAGFLLSRQVYSLRQKREALFQRWNKPRHDLSQKEELKIKVHAVN